MIGLCIAGVIVCPILVFIGWVHMFRRMDDPKITTKDLDWIVGPTICGSFVLVLVFISCIIILVNISCGSAEVSLEEYENFIAEAKLHPSANYMVAEIIADGKVTIGEKVRFDQYVEGVTSKKVESKQEVAKREEEAARQKIKDGMKQLLLDVEENK